MRISFEQTESRIGMESPSWIWGNSHGILWNSWYSRDDSYDFTDRGIRVKDSFGVYIVYDAALEDLKACEEEIMKLATLYIQKVRLWKFLDQNIGNN